MNQNVASPALHALASPLQTHLITSLSSSIESLHVLILSRQFTGAPAVTAALHALLQQPEPKWAALRALLQQQFGSIESLRDAAVGELDPSTLQSVRIGFRLVWAAMRDDAEDESVTVLLRWLVVLTEAVQRESPKFSGSPPVKSRNSPPPPSPQSGTSRSRAPSCILIKDFVTPSSSRPITSPAPKREVTSVSSKSTQPAPLKHVETIYLDSSPEPEPAHCRQDKGKGRAPRSSSPGLAPVVASLPVRRGPKSLEAPDISTSSSNEFKLAPSGSRSRPSTKRPIRDLSSDESGCEDGQGEDEDDLKHPSWEKPEIDGKPPPKRKKQKAPAKAAKCPFDTSMCSVILIRRMLTIPSTIDLSPVDPQLLLDADLSFARPHIGGGRVATIDMGNAGGPSCRHLCLVTGMNVVPRTPGEPLVVFSLPATLRKVICAARLGSAHGSPAPSINIFVQHGPEDWRYRGAYEVRELTPTADDEMDRFIGMTSPGELLDIKTNPAKKDLFRDLFRRFKKWDSTERAFAPWRMELTDAEGGLQELETKRDVSINFLVLTYAGWDAESLGVWSAARARAQG